MSPIPDHGTVNRNKNYGCKCDLCREAYARYSALGKTGSYRDELAVECWCQAKVVGVPKTEVMDCLTRSCGAESCEAPR